MKGFVLLIVLGICSTALADDIYLKDGKQIQNCAIVGENEQAYLVESWYGIPRDTIRTQIAKSLVSRIVQIPPDPASPTVQVAPVLAEHQQVRARASANTFNWKCVPLSAGFFLLAYDEIRDAAAAQRAINDFEANSQPVPDDLRPEVRRKQFIGVSLIAAGALNLLFANERTSVSAMRNAYGVAVHYSF